MSTVLNSEACDLLKEGPTPTVGRNIKKISLQIKSALLPMKKVN
jgi:hypothetical protein